MLTLLPCPELNCDAVAELIDRSVLPSTDGPVPHIKVHCVRGHNLFMPEDALNRSPTIPSARVPRRPALGPGRTA
jgi:hypothetical protein